MLAVPVLLPGTAYEDAADLRMQKRVIIKSNVELVEQRHLEVRELKKIIPVVAREVDDSWFVHFDVMPLKARKRDDNFGKGNTFCYEQFIHIILRCY